MAIYPNSIDNYTFRKLRRLYLIALSAIALSVIVSQIIIRNYLDDLQNDSTLINVAGRQRMLSQKITKEILLISYEKDHPQKAKLISQLEQSLHLFTSSYQGLLKENDSLNLPGKNSKTINAMFLAIAPYYNSIIDDATLITKNKINLDAIPFTKVISTLKINEVEFLQRMDNIVNQYNAEANKKVNRLRNIELILMVITIALLLAELAFIFWPSANFVKTTIKRLLQSKKEAQQNAHDADVLREKNLKSVKELRKLNEIIDKTVLFARLDTNGKVIQLGSKFSNVFKVSRFTKGIPFSELLFEDKTEQNSINTLFTTNRKDIWQDEVETKTKEGLKIWLEMYIIPFFTKTEQSEYLFVALDITSRKKAQLELEQLTNIAFEDRIYQQKLISSKIIESQEIEQDRIAKDIHDGIGQMLTGLKFNLESINPNNKEDTNTKIEYLKELTSSIIKGVRTATFNLAPPELGDYGIIPALAKLCKQLHKYTGKKIEFYNKTNFNKRLDSLVEINVYRITQEAINNAIKYAKSSQIIITLSHSETILSITIDDDGVGFKPKFKHSEYGGKGMLFMKERSDYIKGRIFVTSKPTKGTRIILNIPI